MQISGMPVTLEDVFVSLAIVLTFIAFIPYINGILFKQIKPHVFSWVIWGTTTFVVFLAALQGGGGAGAWPIGVSGVITIGIAVLAFLRRMDVVVTRTDWLFFAAAMSSIPLWYFTADPTWAVIILTTVDVLGFGPTIRKVWVQPRSESILFLGIYILRNILVIAALAQYSIITLLFPVAVNIACSSVIGIMLYRRRQIAELNLRQ